MTVLKIAIFLLFIGSLTFWQAGKLLGRREKKEAVFNTVLMIIAAVIGVLQIAGVPLPSPATPLKAVFEPIGKMFFPAE